LATAPASAEAGTSAAAFDAFRAIDLGKRYKTAIFRRFLVGIPDEEAAAIMGISVYRYRWMLDEARDYLSARLLTRAAGTR
jgi:DNA-directed RNA polymerase specialized sigma24 family protein